MDYLVIVYDWEDWDFLWATEQFVHRLLWFLLACWECSNHYEERLEENPVDLSSREAFAEWVLDAHNNASSNAGKEEWGRVAYSQKLLTIVQDKM